MRVSVSFFVGVSFFVVSRLYSVIVAFPGQLLVFSYRIESPPFKCLYIPLESLNCEKPQTGQFFVLFS